MIGVDDGLDVTADGLVEVVEVDDGFVVVTIDVVGVLSFLEGDDGLVLALAIVVVMV